MAQAKQKSPRKKPNILVIFGDDIGYWNVSAYNLGVMGYRTPNIDRLAKEGALLTDYYGQQSCTAGRAAFNTGQCPFRTGLTTGIDVWDMPFTNRRAPLLVDLRADPLERSEDAVGYHPWLIDRAFYFVPAQQAVARFLSTFKEFPPRQRPGSFSVDQVVEKLEQNPPAMH